MSSFFGLLMVEPVGAVGSVFCRGRVTPVVFDDGVADGLVRTARGDPSPLGVVPLDRGSSPDRRAYGSAVAGRPSSGRRGFMAGRIGADDNDDTWDPVGIVRVVVLEVVVVVDFEGASDTFASVNVDCADPGRGGRAFPGDRCARF